MGRRYILYRKTTVTTVMRRAGLNRSCDGEQRVIALG